MLKWWVEKQTEKERLFVTDSETTWSRPFICVVLQFQDTCQCKEWRPHSRSGTSCGPSKFLSIPAEIPVKMSFSKGWLASPSEMRWGVWSFRWLGIRLACLLGASWVSCPTSRRPWDRPGHVGKICLSAALGTPQCSLRWAGRGGRRWAGLLCLDWCTDKRKEERKYRWMCLYATWQPKA